MVSQTWIEVEVTGLNQTVAGVSARNVTGLNRTFITDAHNGLVLFQILAVAVHIGMGFDPRVAVAYHSWIVAGRLLVGRCFSYQL
jgi:hypothetical protein